MSHQPLPAGPAATVAAAMHEDSAHVVVELERRTPTIAEMWLSPLAEPIAFLPGQYMLLEDAERRLAPRSYSIANAPRPDGRVSLLVTWVAGGQTSEWVHARLSVGDQVSLSGPYGAFLADPAHVDPSVHLAAGSGLAPIRALLEADLATDSQQPLTVVFSARTEADVLDRERFAALVDAHPRLRFVRTLTRGEGAAPHGRIPALLPELCGDLGGHEVFVAGAPGFVSACVAAAEAAGAARAHVHSEVFFVEPQPWAGVPPVGTQAR